jgi:hypothetical protein
MTPRQMAEEIVEYLGLAWPHETEIVGVTVVIETEDQRFVLTVKEDWGWRKPA